MKNRVKILLGLIISSCLFFSCETSSKKNMSPVADAGLDRSVFATIETSFSAVHSHDPDGEIIEYYWDFGDGTTGTGANVNHTYASAGAYILSLEVIDSDGVLDSDQAGIRVLETNSGVYVEGRKVMVNGSPFYIKGVCWSPLTIGETLPDGINYTGFVDQDAPLMAAAGINVVRTYMPLVDRRTLDVFYENGIYIINTMYYWGGDDPDIVIDLVNQVKDHPAILMWCVGNEWNDNGIYYELSLAESIGRLNQAAEAIKSVDSTHPVTTVFATTPNREIINDMPDIDIWGLNYYLDLGFEHPVLGNVFEDWMTRSEKPMFIGEYGADAWNANIPGEDLESQALATRILTQLIWDNSVVHHADKVCSGGAIFEWCDEWWKEGSASTQDIGGITNSFDGPFPDSVYNEEYWGITDIHRHTRSAYDELQSIYTAIDF